MFGILEAVTVPHTGIYNTYEDLITDLNNRVSKDGYKIVKARSHRGRVGGSNVPNNEMVRCDLVCDRGGRPYRCMATKHKTHTKKTDCPWRAKAVHRKTIGGWVLTITCDQHNHEPGTPEPPSPVESEAEDREATPEGPQPDTETGMALQLAGVPTTNLRLTGDTFHQIKGEYRRMPQHERLNLLAQMQLRIAAIYAVQNEDVQRNQRNEALRKRHSQIDEGKKSRQTNKQRTRKTQAQRQQEQQQQQAVQQLPQQQPQQQQPQQNAEMQEDQSVQQQQQQHHQSQQHTPQQHTPQLAPQQTLTPTMQQMQQPQQMMNQHQHHQQQQQQFQLAHQAHQAHQMQQAHMAQASFPMSAPDSPGQQLLMNMAHIQQYNGPTPKRGRGRPSGSGQGTV